MRPVGRCRQHASRVSGSLASRSNWYQPFLEPCAGPGADRGILPPWGAVTGTRGLALWAASTAPGPHAGAGVAGAGRGAEPPKAHAVTRARPAACVTSAAPRRLASGCRWAVTWAPPLNVAVSFLPPQRPHPCHVVLGSSLGPRPLYDSPPPCSVSAPWERRGRPRTGPRVPGWAVARPSGVGRSAGGCGFGWWRVTTGLSGSSPPPAPPLHCHLSGALALVHRHRLPCGGGRASQLP